MTSNTSPIDTLERDIKQLVAQAKKDRDDANFYLRILIQALLTHGSDGVLKIDPKLGEKAKELKESCVLEFGNGEVRIIQL